MSAYTDLVRSALDWIDRHPELPEPAVYGFAHADRPSVDLTWHISQRRDIDQTETAKAIMAAVGGVWRAEPGHLGSVRLAGPRAPFDFDVYVSGELAPRPVPADLRALGVQA